MGSMPIRDSYEPGRPCWVDLGTSDPPVQDMTMGGRLGSLADPQGASFDVLSFATPPSNEAGDS